MSIEKTNRVLDAVWSCLQSSWPEQAKTVKSLKGKGLEDVLNGLSQVERTPRLQTDLWVIIVLAKAVLVGQREEQEMWKEVWRVEGLV